MRNEDFVDTGPQTGPQTGAPPGFMAGKLMVSIEQLTVFEQKVQGVIDLLLAGPMRDKPAGEPVRPGAYGTGFSEATLIQEAMGQVVGQLDRYAKLLNAQIEVMRLSVKMAASGTAEGDAANRQAMARALQASEQVAATPPVAGPTIDVAPGTQPGRGPL